MTATTTAAITYLDITEVVVSQWLLGSDGNHRATAIGCIGNGTSGLAAFEAAIDPDGTWQARHDGQCRSGRARSASDARPHVEDAIAWWVRELAEKHRADGLEQALCAALLKREPEQPVEADEPVEAAPQPAPSHEAAPRKPSTPAMDPTALAAVGKRIQRQRALRGCTWDGLAAVAVREGGPEVVGETYRVWSKGQQAPERHEHLAELLAWLDKSELLDSLDD